MSSFEEEINKDISLLENVLMRLAVVEDNKLESQLNSLLTPVLAKLSTPHEPVRKKVLEVLSHINKRVKPNQNIRLPLQDLVEIYTDATTTPFMTNFIILYLELAFNRAPIKDKAAVSPLLLKDLNIRNANQQLVLMALFLSVLEKMDIAIEETDRQKQFAPFASNPQVISMLMDFFLDVVLTVPYGYNK